MKSKKIAPENCLKVALSKMINEGRTGYGLRHVRILNKIPDERTANQVPAVSVDQPAHLQGKKQGYTYQITG